MSPIHGFGARSRSLGWRRRALGSGLCALIVAISALSCTPVRPEQRAILADPIMRFGADARAHGALAHALENREGSNGGGPVQGGGCGCN